MGFVDSSHATTARWSPDSRTFPSARRILPLHLIHKPVDLLVVHSAELLSSNERRRAVLSQRLSVTIMAMTSVSDRLLANEEALIQRIRLCVQYCLV